LIPNIKKSDPDSYRDEIPPSAGRRNHISHNRHIPDISIHKKASGVNTFQQSDIS